MVNACVWFVIGCIVTFAAINSDNSIYVKKTDLTKRTFKHNGCFVQYSAIRMLKETR